MTILTDTFFRAEEKLQAISIISQPSTPAFRNPFEGKYIISAFFHENLVDSGLLLVLQ